MQILVKNVCRYWKTYVDIEKRNVDNEKCTYVDIAKCMYADIENRIYENRNEDIEKCM